MKRIVLKWCNDCKKLVDVTNKSNWENCPICNFPTPGAPHKEIGY